MSLVAVISVPNIFVKTISPIFTGAFTEVFLISSITSKIFSFGTGLAVLTLTIVFLRFSNNRRSFFGCVINHIANASAVRDRAVFGWADIIGISRNIG